MTKLFLRVLLHLLRNKFYLAKSYIGKANIIYVSCLKAVIPIAFAGIRACRTK